MNLGRQYSTFHADRYHFAIDVHYVQEVLQSMPVTPVPLSGSVIDGLVNLRGQIVTAIDLRARLQLSRRDDDAAPVSLIVRTASGLISLRADRLGDVLEIDSPPASPDNRRMNLEGCPAGAAMRVETLPDTVGQPLRGVTQGIIQLEDSVLLVLDPEQLLTSEMALPSDPMESLMLRREAL